jgi:hypothetical protein
MHQHEASAIFERKTKTFIKTAAAKRRGKGHSCGERMNDDNWDSYFVCSMDCVLKTGLAW